MSYKKTYPNLYRLFIAAFATIEDYESLKYELKPFFKGAWVKEKNLHMTFKFLGDNQNPDLIIERLKNIDYPKEQKIIFKRVKLFNKKILHFRSSNKTLYKLQNKIDELLKDDFKKENNFKPHITLMRIKRVKNDQYMQRLKELDIEAVLKLKLCLVESHLKPTGVKYKILKQW